jgi:hypothetical protein
VALEAEAARVAHYLNGASEPKLLRVCEHEILELRETVLLEKEGSGCRALLANDRKADLARMYRLFGRVPNTPTHGLPPMAALVRAHIEQMGNDIIDRREARLSEGAKDSNQDPAFVKELLALHDKYLAVVSEQFGGNALFQKALKEAFVEFANRDVGKHTNAELMSSFCDRILKSGGEKLGDEDVEAFLEKTVQLFSYLTDKDLFAEIYRNQLAKRLLNQRSASDDAERLMIGKLKLRCGSQFTGKMVRARRPAFPSTPSPRRIERASLRSALPLRGVWYSSYAIDAARASRRWRMGGTRRRRRDISTHTSARGRRVDREALTVLYQRRRACSTTWPSATTTRPTLKVMSRPIPRDRPVNWTSASRY